MMVTVKELLVEVDHDMIEEEGFEPRIESSVRSVGCSATAVVEKRRADAPPLVVGKSHGSSQIRVSNKEQAAGATAYPVVQSGSDAEDLEVTRQQVLEAVERAVVLALRELVEPIDRDLALGADAEML
jgi:hypothetical protein